MDMKSCITVIKEKKQYIRMFVMCFLTGVLAYSLTISNELTNTFDGMWMGTFYKDWSWVMSIGRWFWPAISMLRNHLSPEPFTSCLSIALIVIGAMLIIDTLHNKSAHQFVSHLAVLGMVISTSICVVLSYRYMSPTFAFSFLMSVASVWILEQPLPFKSITSLCMIILTLASYQANIGCTCFLFLLVLIRKISEGMDWIAVGKYFLKLVALTIMGCLFYKIIWDSALKLFHFTVADYRGASKLTVSHLIQTLPENIKNTYNSFLSFFLGTNIRYNVFQSNGFFRVVFLWVVISANLLIWKTAHHNDHVDWLRAIIVGSLMILIPPAVHFSDLLAPDSGGLSIQMTIPHSLVIPVMLYVGWIASNEATLKRIRRYYQYPMLLLMIFVLYGNTLQVSTDQHIMLQSRNTTLSFMNRVIADLEREGLCDSDNQFVFIGRPTDNPLYRKDEVWEYANAYTWYGAFWLGGDCATQSYYGLMRDGGYNIKINFDDIYWSALTQEPAIQNMPSYPNAGYTQTDENGNVIVKLS